MAEIGERGIVGDEIEPRAVGGELRGVRRQVAHLHVILQKQVYDTGFHFVLKLFDLERMYTLPKDLQPGDVPDTYADVEDLVRDTGYRPDTPVEVGVSRFVDWYRSYYGDMAES